LNKSYGPDDVGIQNPEQVKQKLKIFQGEMEIYSAMWGMVQVQVMWGQKWKKRISKNLERVVEDGKVPKEKIREAYKFFTIDPKLLDYHTEQLLGKLGGRKDSFSVGEIIE
jgi:hypothetical protein